MAFIDGTNAADELVGIIGETNDIQGFSGDDTLVGQGLRDYLAGGNGDDDLEGWYGNDILLGDAGDDNLDAGSGDDSVSGGDGDDAIYGNEGADTIDGGRGQDGVYYAGSDSAGVTVNLRTGVGTGGYAEGDTLRFVEDVTGSSNNDVLIGNGVSNVLEGYYGNDTVNGGGGADFLYGGEGLDTLSYGGSVAGVTVHLATGEATGGDATYDEFYEFENLLGSSFADRLTGDVGANRLTGGDGDDSLAGAFGADVLCGGNGADRFIYGTVNQSTTAVAGRDQILDFSLAGDDRIDLSFIDADPGVGGNQAFSFIGTSAFTGEGGEVRYRPLGGSTFVTADVNGDKAADLSIALNGTLALTAGDFVL